MPRTRPSSQRCSASTAPRCPATTSGSTHGRGREFVARAPGRVSGGSGPRRDAKPVIASRLLRFGGNPGHRRGRTDLERILDRTALGRSDPELGTCWVYTGPANPYGRIGKGPERSTHRLGWIWLRGPIPDGMELHHRCGVHACWNREHLKIVTHAEKYGYYTQ